MKQVIIILSIIALTAIYCHSASQIIYSNAAVDFYGYSPQFIKGDRITVYDEQNVLCGEYTIDTNGQYGLMSVYGDDPLSKDIDEGAVPGEGLTFYLNGQRLEPTDGSAIIWTQDGERLRLDF